MDLQPLIGSVVIAAFVAFVLFAIVASLRKPFGGARTFAGLASYETPESKNQWMAPSLLLVSAYSAKVPGIYSDDALRNLILATVVGLLTALFQRQPLQTIRDIFFSALSLIMVPIAIFDYLSSEAEAVGTYVLPVGALVLLIAIFAIGVIVNIARTYRIPKLGIALLGAIEILIFLAKPFEQYSTVREAPIEVGILVFAVAALVGFGAAAAPSFIVPLAALAICIAQIGINVYLWLIAAASGPPTGIDWNAALLILGVQLGVGLFIGLRGLGRGR